MAKKKTAPTAAQVALAASRDKLEAAKKADAAKSTDQTKKAVSDAAAAVKANDATVCRERFVNIGGSRIKKARAAIRNFAAVGAPRSYQFDESDIVKAESALNDEVKKAMVKMRAALVKGAAVAKADDDFSF